MRGNSRVLSFGYSATIGFGFILSGKLLSATALSVSAANVTPTEAVILVNAMDAEPELLV